MSAPTVTQIASNTDQKGNTVVVALGSDGTLWQGSWQPAQGPKAAQFIWQPLPALP